MQGRAGGLAVRRVVAQGVRLHDNVGEHDGRSAEPFAIRGPAARVTLLVDGREVVVDVPPLAILEFRARIAAPEILRWTAGQTAAPLALKFAAHSPAPAAYGVLAPWVWDVSPTDRAEWLVRFRTAEQVPQRLGTAGALPPPRGV